MCNQSLLLFVLFEFENVQQYETGTIFIYLLLFVLFNHSLVDVKSYSYSYCYCSAILAEYSGAVLGVLSAVLYGSRGHVWKKVHI